MAFFYFFKYKMIKTELVLTILSVIFAAIGNLMDITDTDKFLSISKHGYWNNSLFLIFIVIVLELYK